MGKKLVEEFNYENLENMHQVNFLSVMKGLSLLFPYCGKRKTHCKESYLGSLSEFSSKGRVQVYWRSDKSISWTTETGRNINLIYDNSFLPRKYKMILPPGGIQIDSLRLTSAQIPGTITIIGVIAKPLSIMNIEKK